MMLHSHLFPRAIAVAPVRRLLPVLFAAILLLSVTSCRTTNEIGYAQNYALFTSMPDTADATIRIRSLDKLYISLFTTTNPEVSRSFNWTEGATPDATLRIIGGQRQMSYDVPPTGDIDVPLIGEINVLDKTKKEVEDIITQKLRPFFNTDDYVVTVRLNQWTYTVLGEVAHPGLVYTDHESINIYEALATVGDMTIYGLRTPVKVIREHEDGTKSIGELDLTDAAVINSPYFTLHQNDIIYVQPNRAKTRNADVSTISNLWIRGSSIAISLLSLILSIVL